jgi:alpha-tubulin suppressor-like RCC1 family protein
MPVQVTALAGLVVQVATTGTHTCARTIDGALWCWGGNDSGQLGDGTTTDSATPLQVTPLGANVRQVSTSPASHTCACLADGTAWCWGRNDSGQLGDGTTSQSAFPVQVSGLASVVEISAGGFHTCARTSDGALWCWGDNMGGELGNGVSGQRAMAKTPVRVASLGTNVAEVRAGTGRTCARGNNGGIWCWGARDYGMMGDGDLGFGLSPAPPAGCR